MDWVAKAEIDGHTLVLGNDEQWTPESNDAESKMLALQANVVAAYPAYSYKESDGRPGWVAANLVKEKMGGEIELNPETDKPYYGVGKPNEEVPPPKNKRLLSSPIYKSASVVKSGFTGKKRDARGYNICYSNGKRVPCNQLGESGNKPASKKKPEKKPIETSVKEIKDLITSGQGTPAKLMELISGYTIPELKKIQAELGLTVKGNPAKTKRVDALAQGALGLLGKESVTSRKVGSKKGEFVEYSKSGKLVNGGFGESKAKVKLSSSAKEVAKKFGLSDQNLASIAGAPKGAETSVSTAIGVTGEYSLMITTQGKGFYSIRYVGKDNNGDVFLTNDMVMVDDTGSGAGLDMFGMQVENAIKSGVKYIRAHAVGYKGSKYNGYYTWPRFGYDEEIKSLSTRVREKVKEAYPDAKSVQDIMSTKEGRDWWKENGGDMQDAIFDLREGSKSIQIFNSYLIERNASKKGK